MPLQPVTVEKFGGLDLRAAPNQGNAIDMLNVQILAGGDAIRTRDGSALFAGPLATSVIGLATYGSDYDTPTGRRLIAALSGSTGNTKVIDAGGLPLATGNLTGAANNNVSFQQIGTSAANYIYLATTASTNMARYDGTAWTNPAMPLGRVLGLSPADNRLAVGNVAANPHRVQFSDPGSPEVFGANNFVDLVPGDGEAIVAMATWQNQLFVFKQTKIFVFYGTSGDTAGAPIFNYRTIPGVACDYPNAATVGPDGVYFVHRTGVYRTTGGPPALVSGPLDPFFRNESQPFFQAGATFDPASYVSVYVTWAAGRLWCVVGSQTVPTLKTFMWDPASGWATWDVVVAGTRAACFGEARTQNLTAGRVELVCGLGTGVYRVSPTLTTDAGAGISSNYRAAFSDLGIAAEKTVRETLLDGYGTPTLKWSRDWGALGSGQAVTLGTAPALANNRSREAVRGRLLSWELSGTAPWNVQRVLPMLRGSRSPGVRTS